MKKTFEFKIMISNRSCNLQVFFHSKYAICKENLLNIRAEREKI